MAHLRRFGGALVALATCTALMSTAAPASALAGVPISGAGSTAAQNAILDWSANVQASGLSVNYSGTGSTDGRNQFKNSTVDFAVSEVPYGLTDNGVTDPPPSRPFSYLPILAGALAFPYHLTANGRPVTGLRLSGSTLAKIFTRNVSVWTDPAIQADNPGIPLPAESITPVVHSEGSGDTETFTHWMSVTQPSMWDAYCARAGRITLPCGSTSFYPLPPTPGMVAMSGSVGVTGYVAQPQNEGSITYAEATYGAGLQLPMAKVLNAAGYYTAPSSGAVSVSLLSAQVSSSLLANLDGAFTDTDPRAYPLPQISYLIVPTTTAVPFTTQKGATLGAFVSYALCSGTNDATRLNYAPMPQNLVQAGLSAIPRIPGATAPTTDAATCAATATNLIANTPQPQACDRIGPQFCGGGLPTESIDTTLPPGSLVISVDSNPQVVLPSPVLDPSGALLRTSGSLSPLTVTDDRAGNPGWSVSAQVGDFSDGAGHSIAGLNLGWTPSVIDATAAQTVTVGAPVAPSTAGGLSVARTWATGTGLGTTHLGAGVELDVPTSTLAGTYTATLTVTAI